jgi:hypothetical protein
MDASPLATANTVPTSADGALELFFYLHPFGYVRNNELMLPDFYLA